MRHTTASEFGNVQKSLRIGHNFHFLALRFCKSMIRLQLLHAGLMRMTATANVGAEAGTTTAKEAEQWADWTAFPGTGEPGAPGKQANLYAR